MFGIGFPPTQVSASCSNKMLWAASKIKVALLGNICVGYNFGFDCEHQDFGFDYEWNPLEFKRILSDECKLQFSQRVVMGSLEFLCGASGGWEQCSGLHKPQDISYFFPNR